MEKNKSLIDPTIAVDHPKDDQKLVYEKPQLKTVTLFADQVLGPCSLPVSNPPCQTVPRS